MAGTRVAPRELVASTCARAAEVGAGATRSGTREVFFSSIDSSSGMEAVGGSSEEDSFEVKLRLRFLRLKPEPLSPEPFSGANGSPQAVRVICRIRREIGESSSASGMAVCCIRRTAA